MFWLYCLLFIYPCILLHELGHAVMGWRCGYLVTSFGMGIDRPFFVKDWRGVKFYLARVHPLQGLTFAVDAQLYPSACQKIGLMVGGLLVNGLCALLGAALWYLLPFGQYLWSAFAAVNTYLFVCSALPYRFAVGRTSLRTDGARILSVLRGTSVDRPPGDVLRYVAETRRLFTAIGDTKSLYTTLAAEAIARRQLGDMETARRFLDEAAALPGLEEPYLHAHCALTRAIVTSAEAEADAERNAALDEAKRLFREMNHAAGSMAVQWLQMERLIVRQEPGEALEGLNSLAAGDLVRRRPSARIGLLVMRLSAAAALPDDARTATLYQEYKAKRRRHPSLLRDLHVRYTMGGWCVRREDWASAEEHYRQGLESVRQLYAGCPDAAARDAFARSLVGLLEQAQTCFQQVGKSAEAEALSNFFAEMDAAAQRQEEAQYYREQDEQANRLNQAKRNRTLYLYSLFLTLAGSLAGAMGVQIPTKGVVSEPGFAFLMLLICSVVTALLNLVLYVLCRYISELQRSGAQLALFIAFVPWMTWLVFLCLT